MQEKSKDPDIYKIQKELFREEVRYLTIRVIGGFEHDHGDMPSCWDEVPIYVLASLLLESLTDLAKHPIPGLMDSEWLNLYPETHNTLLSLSNLINSKLGSTYFLKDEYKP